MKIVVSKGRIHQDMKYAYSDLVFRDKMQVPLHLLCDDLLLYQEVTGNMYKLCLKSVKENTVLSLSPKEKDIISKHLDLR